VRILLWRHGRTAWNHDGRFQGQADPPLDEVGRLQARLAAPFIAGMRPSVVVSSDLRRASDTAAALGLPVRADPRLREIDLGGWSGLTATQAAARFPEEDEAWRRGDDVRRGGGETYEEVGGRSAALVDEVLATGDVPRDGLLVLVTHGGTARSLIGRLLELSPRSWWRFGPLGNCRWTLLRDDARGYRLVEHNAGAEGPREGAGARLPAEGIAPSAPDVEPVHSTRP
jgi:probable phosphoglycerate mutase